MRNPFAESHSGDATDLELVERANNGDRAALEALVLRHQAWIYNIAVRMVYRPDDAEEVTQEVLVKMITQLSTFRGESRFRTWLYRIAANHVLNMKRRPAEREAVSFTEYGAAVSSTPDRDLPDPAASAVDLPLLVEETRLRCTAGMLLCLDRRQRLIFTLGAIVGVTDVVGSEILGISADNFRQCLARARRDLSNFMNNQCGLINKSNPCRCPRKTMGFIEAGHVDPEQILFADKHVQRIAEVAGDLARHIDDIVERQHVDLFRDHPFLSPPDQVQWLRRLLDDEHLRGSLRLA